MTNGWESVTEESIKNGSDMFLRVKVDCRLKVRLIGKAVKIFKIFVGGRKCILLNSEDVGRQLKGKYPDMVGNVSVRFACWCIDRNTNTMKILDMPQSVFRAFSRRVGLISLSPLSLSLPSSSAHLFLPRGCSAVSFPEIFSKTP